MKASLSHLIALVVAFVGISFAAPLARLADVDGYTAAWWRLLGVLLCFLGIVMLSTLWAGATLLEALLSFTAAVFAAMYFLVGRFLRTSGVSTLEYTSVAYLAAFLTLLASMPLTGIKPWLVPNAVSLTWCS